LAPETLPESIQRGLGELRREYSMAGVRCLSWNEYYVAIALNIPVDLPSRGPVDGLDIRPVEPILLLVHKQHYPYQAPYVYADRKDFPIARLPHLNPTSTANLAWLCLHRGSLNDWFAEHSLADLVRRVGGWLRDAASNRLIRSEDRFEGTRVENPFGILVYDAVDITKYVERQWEESAGQCGMSYLMATLLRAPAVKVHYPSRASYHVSFAFADPPPVRLIDCFQLYNRIIGESPQEDRLLIGLLVWAPKVPHAEYFGSLPTSYGELRIFCERIGIDLESAVEDYRNVKAQLLGGVPIVVALLRPQILIGEECAIECLHFTALATDECCEADGRWKDEVPVLALTHRNPLTPAFARKMSREGKTEVPPLAILGCGAVGSKLSLYLARAGHVNQTLVDEADLSPHHLVRHGLSPDYVGKNKAEAIKEYIAPIYRLNRETLGTRAFPVSVYAFLDQPEELARLGCMIDATASSAVLNALICDSRVPNHVRVSRCEIADEGRLGLLLWEGPERNPRLDDLQATLFSLGLRSDAVARWLISHRRQQAEERAAALEEIGIGMSCSSTTLRLADDVVSFHASLFSAGYKQRDVWAKSGAGVIQLSELSSEKGISSGACTILVRGVTVLSSRANSSWRVRLQAQAREKVYLLGRRAGKKETGGLLLGFAHRKRRVIYVTDVLPPSRDSKGTPYAFKRGVKDYPETLNEIEARTGGLIGYVGEWHTHPDGSLELSDTDMTAVEQIRAHLDAAGLPTHIMVFGGGGIASFVFIRDG